MIFQHLINRLNNGEKTGITSVCSANNYVIEAAMLHAKENNYKLLIESTSNQVDQFGGYTGMTPEMFFNYVTSVAKKVNFPMENLVLGGDHLGPNVWKEQSVNIAMKNTGEQVAAYVAAGYTKIHLDSSFALTGDETVNGVLPVEIITERAAQMCEVAERTSEEIKSASKPVYVIGTDVPIPGGATVTEESIKLTSAEELEETIELTKKAFYKRGLHKAWERVIAVVVQPGVEFSDSKVFPYVSENNRELINKIENYNGLYFEAHSTDYQKLSDLKQMVNDHFAILKVGPWLTFALREALFSLSYIESEMLKFQKGMQSSELIDVINKEMKANPQYWLKHYSGNENEIHLALNFSYSDRIRYYWTNSTINKTVEQLLGNLEQLKIPESLLSQFFPSQYWQVREGKIENNPKSLILNKISEVLNIYHSATGGVSEK
jgi:D-tagatose-1,6-bisphosphate aldolase subunit GatZ/KbaZ